jgi:Na+-translocating ferredoxin:NAD+ oxidoreductase RnfG subunit
VKQGLNLVGLATLAILIAVAGLSWAEEAATEKTKGEKAVEEYFGDGAEIMHKSLVLADPKLAAFEEQLGFSLVAESAESEEDEEDEEVERKATFDYYFVKSGENAGVAAVVSTMGKWAPVTYLVALDFDAVVTRVEVIDHSERRGKGIERRTFLGQFDGKTSGDDITIMKDITAVSGATVSSRSATEAVRAAIVAYEEFFLKVGAAKDAEASDDDHSESKVEKAAEQEPTETDVPAGTEEEGE